MGDAADHAAWAQRFLIDADATARAGRYDWATVAYAYTALHIVHSALPSLPRLTTQEQHPEAHEGRVSTNGVVREHASPIRSQYLGLFTAGIDVRYNGRRITKPEVDRFRHVDLEQIGAWACRAAHPQPCDCWMRRL